MGLTIAEINIGAGRLAISPMPGRGGDYAGDMADLLAWQPALVISLTTQAELDAIAPGLAADLARSGTQWRHFPIPDYSTPATGWPALSPLIYAELAKGGRVLLHCMGGCGRSGMIALRLMVEAGEDADAALIRLRGLRPCAVETDDQYLWARNPGQFA
ncbi:MAG: protein phosphatase [Rhodobacteraceae bacterium]|nr:protein phosphatase [Paracoccaceae bacterium]